MAGINSPNALNGINPLAYIGTTASAALSPASLSVERRDPKSGVGGDYKNWNLGALWLNQVNEAFWVLVAKTATTGTWVTFSGASGGITKLRASDGNLANPNAGIVNVFQGTGILTTADNVHTLTVSTTADVATSYVTDAGTAVPAAHILNIFGDGVEISTSGAGNTVTITGTITNSFDQIAVQVFGTAGSFTYTPTVGMKYCIVECVGAGGGGGGAAATGAGVLAAGGGGAGGSYCRKVFDAVTIGASKALVVGAGGAGGVGAGAGATGGNTTFGALLSAGGGSPGQSEAVGTNPMSASPGGTAAATGGDINSRGDAGGASFGCIIAGGQAVNGGFGGGTVYAGQTGAVQIAFIASASQNGNPGKFPGGGGGGAAVTDNAVAANGGAGADGIVIITEFIH